MGYDDSIKRSRLAARIESNLSGNSMGKKWLILGALALLTFLQGAIDQYFYPGQIFPPSTLWLMPVGIFLMFWWFVTDAKYRNYRRSALLNIGVIFFAMLALPYYFFRSRGFKYGLVSTGLFVLALIASSYLSTAGRYAAYYGLQS